MPRVPKRACDKARPVRAREHKLRDWGATKHGAMQRRAQAVRTSLAGHRRHNLRSMRVPSIMRALPGDTASIDIPVLAEERELVHRLGHGDESALKRLLWLYREDIVRYTLNIVQTQDQAEDVAQEVFIRVWTNRERWQHMHTIRPVLYRIARNLALNEARRVNTFQRWVRRLRTGASAGDPSFGPFQHAVSAELDAAVRRAVDALPKRRREIFVLVRFHRMSHREAGEVLGISPQAVANQMSRALSDLHAALDPHLEGDSAQPIDFPLARTAAWASDSSIE